MKEDKALELLSILSPHPAPIKCILSELRLANDIELRALCDELRIKYSVNTRLHRDPHDTNRIVTVCVTEDTWRKAQEIAFDYERSRELLHT